MKLKRTEQSNKPLAIGNLFARHKKTAAAIAVACALSAVTIEATDACGPFSKIAVFVTNNHPDFPLKRFAAGDLGVINPSYARSFLVVAYRYLAGIENTPKDQKAFVALWERRLESMDVDVQLALKAWTTERNKVLNVTAKDINAYDTNGYMGYLTFNADAFNTATRTLKAKIEKYGAGDQRVKEWLKNQDAIFGISSNSDDNSGDKGKAKSTDAVANAQEASDDARYQSACEDFYSKRFDAAAEKFQAIAADTSSPWQKWGDYLAARAFCRKATMGEVVSAEDLQRARASLEKVLQSKNTDMHPAAKRLAGFVEYRLNPDGRAKQVVAALLAKKSDEDMTEALGDYTLLLDKVLEKPTTNSPTSMRSNDMNEVNQVSLDPTLLGVAVMGSLGFLSMHRFWWRNRNGEQSVQPTVTIALAMSLSALSCGLAACTKTEQTPVSKTDTATHIVAQASDDSNKTLPSPSDVVFEDDMTKWILNFQDSKSDSINQALDEWKKTKSLPWLVSVVSKLKSTDARKSEVLAEAAKVSPDSPAYLTLQYHQVRLLLDENKQKEAAAQINAVLAEVGAKLPPSARNGLFEMGVSCAGSIAEFVKMAAPSPAVITWDYDSNELPDTDSDFEPGPVKLTPVSDYFKYTGCLTDKSAEIVNNVTPLPTYVLLANNANLPAAVRLDLAQAGWVRSVLLKNEKSAMTLSSVLSKLRPQLSKSLASYDTAKSGTDKEYAALITILRNPGMRPYVTPGLPRETAFDKIDSYRNNWWDAVMPEAPRNMYADDEDREDRTPQKKQATASFLSPSELTQGQKEAAAITALGTAPNSLAQRVLALSKANPKDPRLAEMLHLVVTTTRYGNTDDKTTAYSKQAFQALHKHFPGNEWTKKTKFWF